MCEILSAMAYLSPLIMTIPSRPAPPPPKPVNIQPRQHTLTANQSQSRYGSTNWDSFENNFFEQSTNILRNKKNPPPRPPPPKLSSQPLKKPGQPTSVNLLSNLFGKTKINGTKVPPISNTTRSTPHIDIPKLPAPHTTAVSQDTSLELISFDSPPNSPTLTQKSNSDCNSIGSFSSDSNNYTPHNGRTSQPESGFEDDFSSSKDLWDTNDPFSPLPYDASKSISNQKPVTIGSTSFYSFDSYSSGSVKPVSFDDPLCNGKSLLAPEPTLTKPTIIKPAITRPKPKLNSLLPNKGPAPSLPMPNIVAPAPPSGHIFDENEPSYGIAMYDFEPIQDGDLGLRENEKVYLHKKLNDEWYFGKNRRGCEGMFPASYINVKVPIREASPNQSQKSQATTSKPPIEQSQPTARALYNFTAEAPEDLSLQENDIITDLQKINEEWLFGRIGSRHGQFPANFVEFITS